MFGTVVARHGVSLRRLRTFAGLTAAFVPGALLVHLVAEAAAAGSEGLTLSFVVRHAYFGVLFALGAAWFATTIGLGRSTAECRRRCALLRAELAPSRRAATFLHLAGANLGFFALTQAVEGVPIASGAVALGLMVGILGSLLSAFLLLLFGSSIAAAGLESVIGTAPLRRACAALARRVRHFRVARHATFAYSLFIPNRPPPTASRV